MGVRPDRLQERVKVLTDSEVLALQRQLMPLEEQRRAAGVNTKILIPVVAVGVGAMTVAMFMFYADL